MTIMKHDMEEPAGKDCVLKVMSPSPLLRRLPWKSRKGYLIERDERAIGMKIGCM